MNFEHSPRREYPAIELDMTNFMEHLSDEYICGKVKVKDDSVETNPNITDIKTEDCTDLGDTSSIFVHGLKREEKVRELKSKTCLIMKAFDKHCHLCLEVYFIHYIKVNFRNYCF